MNVKGTMSTATNTRNDKTSGTHTEITHEKVNNITFLKNNIGVPDKEGVGGEIRDLIFGNRVIEMTDPRGTFTIKSAGSLELFAGVNMKQTVIGAYTGTVGGAYSEKVTGAVTFTSGGVFDITSGGLMNITAGLDLTLTAPKIFLN